MTSERLRILGPKRQAPPDQLPCLVHDGHRWLLPVIALAQERKQLPKPVTLVMFDRAADNRDPLCVTEIRRMAATGPTVEAIRTLCRDHLSPRNDDWLIAGLELGLIGHVVTFGVTDRQSVDLREYTDGTGFVHHLEYPELPGEALRYPGSLCAVDHRECLARLWRILGWLPILPLGFAFEPGLDRIMVSLDLGCFAVKWRDYTFPWPEEVFVKEFRTPSPDHRLAGMTGRDFVEGLVTKAGLIAIAREPDHCGCAEKADEIMERLNQYLFGGSLAPVPGTVLPAGSQRRQASGPLSHAT